MQYYRCKCGKSECWTTDSPNACDRCKSCGSNLADGPKSHKEPIPHEFTPTLVETDDGMKELSRCIWCRRTRSQIEKEGD